MTARRDRAIAHARLVNLRTVLEEDRWPADGPDLLEAAILSTSRPGLLERARGLRWATTSWAAAGCVLSGAASLAALGGLGLVALVGFFAAELCLIQAGMALEGWYRDGEAADVHRWLRQIAETIATRGAWVAPCSDLLTDALAATRPHGRHR